jgi:hypothetical protein
MGNEEAISIKAQNLRGVVCGKQLLMQILFEISITCARIEHVKACIEQRNRWAIILWEHQKHSD